VLREAFLRALDVLLLGSKNKAQYLAFLHCCRRGRFITHENIDENPPELQFFVPGGLGKGWPRKRQKRFLLAEANLKEEAADLGAIY
jgi:hypothetical protein